MFNVTSNIRQVLSFTDRLSSQYAFAVASALTDTVKVVQRAMPDAAAQDLQEPTRFTRAGFYIVPARKDRLVASVGIKDKQAQYLRYQVDGGRRAPLRKALRLPSEVQLDASGNMPAGLVRQLVARAKANKRATKTQAQRFGVSQALDLFYGEPGEGRPAGIYKRVVLSATRHQLIPIVVFPKQSAQYKPRFKFRERAQSLVAATFEPALRKAWARAMATAR